MSGILIANDDCVGRVNAEKDSSISVAEFVIESDVELKIREKVAKILNEQKNRKPLLIRGEPQ